MKEVEVAGWVSWLAGFEFRDMFGWTYFRIYMSSILRNV